MALTDIDGINNITTIIFASFNNLLCKLKTSLTFFFNNINKVNQSTRQYFTQQMQEMPPRMSLTTNLMLTLFYIELQMFMTKDEYFHSISGSNKNVSLI